MKNIKLAITFCTVLFISVIVIYSHVKDIPVIGDIEEEITLPVSSSAADTVNQSGISDETIDNHSYKTLYDFPYDDMSYADDEAFEFTYSELFGEKADITQDTPNTEMNLTQIQAGDYSSLLGTWKEIAYSNNLFDGTGQQWHTGRSDASSTLPSSTLSVSTEKIDFNRSAVIIQGNTLTDGNGSHLVSFENDGTSLDAYADSTPAIYWSVTFYPKGAANNLEPNNGVQIDNTKNLIVVYYSGMRVQTVFEQE